MIEKDINASCESANEILGENGETLGMPLGKDAQGEPKVDLGYRTGPNNVLEKISPYYDINKKNITENDIVQIQNGQGGTTKGQCGKIVYNKRDGFAILVFDAYWLLPIGDAIERYGVEIVSHVTDFATKISFAGWISFLIDGTEIRGRAVDTCEDIAIVMNTYSTLLHRQEPDKYSTGSVNIQTSAGSLIVSHQDKHKVIVMFDDYNRPEGN